MISIELQRLEVQGFRNLQPQQIHWAPGLNYLAGGNGAGKTSVLEAIHMLASGKSFRASKARQCLQRGNEGFVLHALWQRTQRDSTPEPLQAGLHWQAGQWRRRMNRIDVKQQAEIARHLPLRALHPQVHQLVSGGPDQRRKLLNWLLFHVEPDFLSMWQGYNRARKQRNELIKTGRAGRELEFWDELYVRFGEGFHQLQQRVFDSWAHILGRRLSVHPDLSVVKVQFYQGWNRNLSLIEVLRQGREQELQQGHSLYGPHRMDIQLHVEGMPARDFLSRGQQKLLAYQMNLSACEWVASQTGAWPILLMDDVQSELDASTLEGLLTDLQQSKVQIVATGVDGGCMKSCWPKLTMFHVEQGRVTAD